MTLCYSVEDASKTKDNSSDQNTSKSLSFSESDGGSNFNAEVPDSPADDSGKLTTSVGNQSRSA